MPPPQFYLCAAGVPHLISCRPGTLYSAALMTCDHAANVDCQPQAPPEEDADNEEEEDNDDEDVEEEEEEEDSSPVPVPLPVPTIVTLAPAKSTVRTVTTPRTRPTVRTVPTVPTVPARPKPTRRPTYRYSSYFYFSSFPCDVSHGDLLQAKTNSCHGKGRDALGGGGQQLGPCERVPLFQARLIFDPY